MTLYELHYLLAESLSCKFQIQIFVINVQNNIHCMLGLLMGVAAFDPLL